MCSNLAGLQTLFLVLPSSITKLVLFVRFKSLFYSQQFFHSCQDGSSWVEPVLCRGKSAFSQEHNAVPLVRLKPATPQSRAKHSTTESPRSYPYFMYASSGGSVETGWKCGQTGFF